MIKIFGHISPDTDSTISAILYSWYINTHTTEKATPFVLGQLNKETSFVLKEWNIEEPQLLEKIDKEDSVIIVDTNNIQELFPNINETSIMAIFDHHMLTGTISTNKPIEINMKPVASTATILHDIFEQKLENGILSLTKENQGLMLSAILSDTLGFRSPTTTPHDIFIAEKIAKNLNIEVQEYANKMFNAKSDISDFSDKGLIHIDSKKTSIGDKNIRISVVETTNPNQILERKDSIVNEIKNILSTEKDIDDILFFIIDIFKEEAIVFTYNDFIKKLIEKSFSIKIENNEDTKTLSGIVSRKKQIIQSLQLP